MEVNNAAPSSSSWPKRLHRRLLKSLTKSSKTNVDMALFRWLSEENEIAEGNPSPPASADDKKVLCALAPLRYATLAFRWQRLLARRVVEHPKVGCPGVVDFVVARQRWFDGVVKESAAQGVEQVVALAAGYELRAHRCASPSLTFFEVDLPHASLKKQKLVKKLGLSRGEAAEHPSSRVRHVACDLSQKGKLRLALEAAGFDPKRPVLFTAEGLIYYLDPSAAEGLVREVGELIALASPSSPSSPSLSRLAFDYLHSDALEAGLAAGIGGGGGGGKEKVKMPRAYEVTARSVAAKGEPFKSGVGASPLAAAAWVASASGGALSLRIHATTRAAADEFLGGGGGGGGKQRDVLSFYSFLVAEAAGPVPPSAAGGAGGGGGGGASVVLAGTDAVVRAVVA